MNDIVDDVHEVAEGVMQMGIKKTLGFAGILSGIFGFIADVLQPLAPFAMYLFIASAVLFVGSLIYYAKSKKGIVIAIMSLCATLVLGAVTLLQTVSESKENGFASKMIPGIEKLQGALGVIDKKLDDIKQDASEIKDTTASIKSDTENISNNTGEIRENTDRLIDQGARTNQSIDNLGEKIDDLSNNGGIKSKPTTAEDFYHNAKLYELKGDYGNARRAYKSYTGFRTGKLEPHLRLTDFLRANEGRAGAQEEYGILTRGNDSIVVKYTKLLLSRASTRKESLIAFQQEHPEFAPVYYHLSTEFSEEKLGKQQLSEKRQEYQWLSRFKELDDNEEYVKYFVDKDRLLEWKNDVYARLKIAESNLQEFNNAVSIIEWRPTKMPNFNDSVSVLIGGRNQTKSGLNGIIEVLEPALDIQVKMQGASEFTSLGVLSEVDPRTNKPKPRQEISLSHDQLKAQDIEIRYKDVEGEWSKTYLVKLEYKHMFGAFEDEEGKIFLNPSMLSHIKNNQTKWASFRYFSGDLLVYTTNLLKCRAVIEEIRYSLNSDKVDKVWKMQAFADLGTAPISSVPDDEQDIHLSIPLDTEYITIQLNYKDGTKSELVKIVNPDFKKE